LGMVGSTFFITPACDGSTDDTAVIQAALTGYQNVQITKTGICMISSTLNLHTGQKFSGPPGTTIRLANGSNCIMIQNASGTIGDSDLTIDGLTFDQNYANQVVQGNYPLWWGESSLFINVTRLKVLNTNWLNAGKYSVYVNGATDLVVDHTHCNTYSDCVHVNSPVTRGFIHDTTYDLAGSPGDDTVAIGIGDFTGYTAIPAGNVQDVFIEGVYTNSPTNGVKLYRATGQDAYSMSGVTVRTVQAYNTASTTYGIELGAADATTMFLTNCDISDVAAQEIVEDSATWIGTLNLSNIRGLSSTVGQFLNINSRIDNLKIDGISTVGQSIGAGYLIQFSNATIGQATINNLSLIAPTLNNSSIAVRFVNSTTIGPLVGANWIVQNIGDVMIQSGTGPGPITAVLSNIYTSGIDNLFEFYGAFTASVNGLWANNTSFLSVADNAASVGSIKIYGYTRTGTGTALQYINAGSSITTVWPPGNCSSSASPAVCGTAATGSVAIPTGTVSVALTVNTTAVTANSQILLFPDDSLGTKLGVTCNSTLATLVGGLAVTARTAGTSFTVTYNGTIATNPLCVSYQIVN
jgi:hypothetical protein